VSLRKSPSRTNLIDDFRLTIADCKTRARAPLQTSKQQPADRNSRAARVANMVFATARRAAGIRTKPECALFSVRLSPRVIALFPICVRSRRFRCQQFLGKEPRARRPCHFRMQGRGTKPECSLFCGRLGPQLLSQVPICATPRRFRSLQFLVRKPRARRPCHFRMQGGGTKPECHLFSVRLSPRLLSRVPIVMSNCKLMKNEEQSHQVI
jgi:hypothetical protein